MDLDNLANLTDSDKAIVSNLATTLRKERAHTRAQQSHYETLIARYQSQILNFADDHKKLLHNKPSSTDEALLQHKLAEARKQVQHENDARISNLQSSLVSIRDAMNALQQEKLSSDQALSHARESASQDATLILQLREEVQQLRNNRDRLASESVEKHSRNMELLRESKEANSKVIEYEETTTFLRGETRRLTTELAQLRTQMKTQSVSHDAALSTANQTNIDLSTKLAAANTRVNKLSTDVGNMERHVIDLRADFDRERSDLQAQIENLKKLVEMHKESTKDAEIRLAGYSEVLGTLADERREAERRASQNGAPSLDKHAEVLFKNLNHVLDAKLDVLESERHELIRARASEASMATRQQALIREAETARREADEAKRQVALLEAELAAQKNSYDDLRRNSLMAAQASGFRSPSVLPRTENMGASVPIKHPSFGYGAAMQTETPTPFRNTGRMIETEQALANVMEIRRRHEAILDGIRERRRTYGLHND